jgi:hypothetical protein
MQLMQLLSTRNDFFKQRPLLGNGRNKLENNRTAGNFVSCAVRAEAIQLAAAITNLQTVEELEIDVRWPPACEDVSPGNRGTSTSKNTTQYVL